jgi:hypothetical protein
MTRREFAAIPGLALAALDRPRLDQTALPAIAAKEMPATLFVERETVAALRARDVRFVEERVYASSSDLKPVFRDLGMPVLEDQARLLFVFESLEVRESAWRELAFDPRWNGSDAVLKEIAIYKV